MKNLIPRIEERIANRITIAENFKTDSLTTHNILQNTNFNFIKQFIANNNEEIAQQLWDECHPFKYPAHDSRDYFSMDIDFIKKYFLIFASKSFFTSSGWGKYDPIQKIVPYEYKSGYLEIAPVFL